MANGKHKILNEKTRASNATRICSCCGQQFGHKEKYTQVALINNWSVYRLNCHIDCWAWLKKLGDAFEEATGRLGYNEQGVQILRFAPDDLRGFLDGNRGYYPHVVCRLELYIERQNRPTKV